MPPLYQRNQWEMLTSHKAHQNCEVGELHALLSARRQRYRLDYDGKSLSNDQTSSSDKPVNVYRRIRYDP